MSTDACQSLLEALSDYLDDSASKEICAEIERELARCENCRVLVNTLRKTILLYQRMPQPDIPSAVRERLYKTLQLEEFVTRR